MPSALKRLRQRFGIAARPVRVRAHLAWYWRWLILVMLASLSLALGAWVYDAGRRFAGFDKSELDQQLSRLRESAARLEAESARLRAIANAGESKLKVEQAAQGQLARQVKALEEENGRLREDLAFFVNLAPSRERITVNRFTVRPDSLPGEYRYRLLVVMGGAARDRQFQGSVQLVINVQSEGRQNTIVLPAGGQEDPAFKLNLRYFQLVDGGFRLPESAVLKSVQVRVLERGSSQVLAAQSADLSL